MWRESGPPGRAIRSQGGDLEGTSRRSGGSIGHHRHEGCRAWSLDRATEGRGRRAGHDEGHVMAGTNDTQIRAVLRDHARLRVDVATLDTDADLFAAGM